MNIQRLGLGGKIVLVVVFYTLAGLALLSVLLFQWTQRQDSSTFRQRAELAFQRYLLHLEEELLQGKRPPAWTDRPQRQPAPASDAIFPRVVSLYEMPGLRPVADGRFRVHKVRDMRGEGPPALLIGDPPPSLALDEGGLVFFKSIGHLDRAVIVRALVPFPVQNRRLGDLYLLLAKVAAVLALVALLLALSARYAILKPILHLSEATERIGEDALETRVEVRTGDELEQLANRFNDMIERIRRMRDSALDASPLSGLPGNNSIAQRIEEALATDAAQTVIYVDIDNFKAYNDVYGFEAGDRALLYTADVLDQVVNPTPVAAGFLGHVGGDDFVMVVPDERAAEVAREACARFDADVTSLYTPEDVRAGGIVAKDRQGQVRTFPLMTISLAGVPLQGRGFMHVGQVANVAADVKKAAKAKDVSVFVMDQRTTITALKRAEPGDET